MKKLMPVLLVILGLFSQVAMAEDNTSDRSNYIGISTRLLTGDRAADSQSGHTDYVQGRGTGLIIGVNLDPDLTDCLFGGVFPSLEISYAQANGIADSMSLPGGNAQKAKISNVELSAIISGRPNSRNRPFLRLGLGDQSIKYTTQTVGGATSGSTDNVLLIVGVGIDVNIIQNLHARVEILNNSITTSAAASAVYFY